MSRPFSNCCPINERTADGSLVGQCFMPLKIGEGGGLPAAICPRHGDVTKAREKFMDTGRLTDERELSK